MRWVTFPHCVAAIALYDLPGNGIRFTPAAHAEPAAGTQATVEVSFEVPGDQFVGWKGDLPLEFYVFVLDDTEQVRTYVRTGRVIAERDVADRVLRTGFHHTNQLQLPYGRQSTLRFVVRNAGDGTLGTATMKVTPALLRDATFIADPVFPAVLHQHVERR